MRKLPSFINQWEFDRFKRFDIFEFCVKNRPNWIVLNKFPMHFIASIPPNWIVSTNLWNFFLNNRMELDYFHWFDEIDLFSSIGRTAPFSTIRVNRFFFNKRDEFLNKLMKSKVISNCMELTVFNKFSKLTFLQSEKFQFPRCKFQKIVFFSSIEPDCSSWTTWRNGHLVTRRTELVCCMNLTKSTSFGLFPTTWWNRILFINRTI